MAQQQQDDLDAGIMTEWIVSSQGFVESASATWLTRQGDRWRVTEQFRKGDLETRDSAIVDILARGMPTDPEAEGAQEIHRPRWFRKE